ncbi:dienelactone hydrolase family protein [Thiohalomonas denitrificans]|uniref:Dienelactone hydrolase n=1 Tax=Thiohalomonas denitrificans TaxID=415747 RepID=A0A1G5PHU9_9GAMM|nr:alpha/beta family hydrolase [Thiohalomonas denitrificans]SCZ49095.1 Dienelactone hydrolase [Thiohalomonas denitrificans]
MSDRPAVAKSEVMVETPDATLPGNLNVPAGSRAIVLFAHGSGSSRLSPRNRLVAEDLNGGGLATLLFDLLTPDEHQIDQYSAELRFDIGLLSRRLGNAVDWVRKQPELHSLAIGLFGASTGAAAALRVAAEKPESISAVVSRGGRPDMAGEALPRVKAPTLLLVGGRDEQVIQLNREAADQMQAEIRLEIIPGATHLFEEPGKLEEVARLAREWLQTHTEQ